MQMTEKGNTNLQRQKICFVCVYELNGGQKEDVMWRLNEAK